jgi:Peptidase family M23
MHILITHGNLSRTHALNVRPFQLALLSVLLAAVLLALSAVVYHVIFMKAAREGWPIVSSVLKLVVRDEFAQRDRFVRENLDAMAQKVGEMQAKMIRLEAISERVSGMAGVKADDLRIQPAPGAASAPTAPLLGSGRGGPFVPSGTPSMDQLGQWVASVDAQADQRADVFTLIESRLLENRLSALMVPSSAPVSGPVGSGFGFRSDPFTGRAALHTGLDFPAETGTPITSAAGGVVINVEYHNGYGNMIEIDHNNGLVTRYAHASKIVAKQGDLVRRGQTIAYVGSTGRSTGPHLHFEVLLEGVQQDPIKFLGGSRERAARGSARRAAGGPDLPLPDAAR